MKKTVIAVFVIALFSGALRAEGAQDDSASGTAEWPGGPITITCPWSAGGVADMSIRAVAEHGQKYFGVPTIPVVRTGAGGAVAITEFLKHQPNDPQLIMASEGLFAITPLISDVAYKWEDYVPVIGNVYNAFILVVDAKGELETLDDLIARGREETITVAITGDNLLFVGAFFDQAGVSYEAVPYGGAPEVLTAVLAGDVTVGVTLPALAQENVRAGMINPLMVFDDKPWQNDFYNIPPVTDYGYDVVFPNLNFFLMPAGTDPEIIAMVHENMAAIYEEPSFQEFVKKLNLVIRPVGREEIEAHIDNAVTKARTYYDIVY